MSDPLIMPIACDHIQAIGKTFKQQGNNNNNNNNNNKYL